MMMRTVMKINNFYVVTVSALLGVILSGQLSLSIIFYGNYVIDWVISVIVLLGSFVVAHKYWKPSSAIANLWQWAFIPIALFGRQLEYTLYSYSEAVSLLSYLILMVGAVAVVNTSFLSGDKSQRKPLFYILALGAFALAFVVGYQTKQNSWVLILGLLTVGCQAFLAWNQRKIKYTLLHIGLVPLLTLAYMFSSPLVVFSSQKKFHDKVIFSKTTPFQRIDITSWKGEYWFYYNGVNQFSSIDEWLYYEPMVHPAMLLAESRKEILVIGGENGLIARELLKYEDMGNIHLLPMDSALYRLAKEHALFTHLNLNAHDDQRITVHFERAFQFLSERDNAFDVILIDIPDPLDLEINQYFTKEFYALCSKALKEKGILLTQAGSPYFATKAFYSINTTLKAAGFATIPMHNQVLSLGEWGWIMGGKGMTTSAMKHQIKNLDFNLVKTKWFDRESMAMMMAFGKPQAILDSLKINSLKNPVVHKLYTQGTWKF